ncbi:MAG: LacI family DNA-binding transcriptional regulator [Planctomycetota bacterium]
MTDVTHNSTLACRSITDLANQTGVSTGTVSRVLNQRGRVSPETRQRVLRAARDANFRPRMTARRTHVAVISDRARYAVPGGYVANLMSHMADELADGEYAIELYTEGNVTRLNDRFIDGILTMAWDDSTIRALRRVKNVPVVMISRQDLPEFSVVGTDHAEGGRMVADHLLDRGHRRIAVLSEDMTFGLKQRVQGFRDAFERRGLAFDESLVGLTRHQPVYSAVGRLLQLNPSALFIGSEDLSLEVTHVLTRVFGRKIGQDLSVIGMETPSVSQFLDPPLSTLAQPLDKIAYRAVRLLIEQMQAPAFEPAKVILPNELIARESVVDIASSPAAAG